MRTSWTRLGGALLIVAAVTTGCQQQAGSSTGTTVMMDDLMIENESLREELAQRNVALQETNDELRDRSQEVARLRRDLDDAERVPMTAGDSVVMGQPTATPASYGRTGFEGISNVDTTVSAGEITATIGSDLLFDSGKATLKSNAKSSLDQIVRVLNAEHGGSEVRITGHTDSDPIRKSGHRSNYHLGFERTWAVRDYLVSKGVDSSRIACESLGPARPMATKKASRRVDITVILN